MADQETPTMDDKELFQSAMADEPAQVTAEPEAPATSERPRDEHGRFVAQDPEGNTPKVETQEEVKTEPKRSPRTKTGKSRHGVCASFVRPGMLQNVAHKK
jgi:hypothetical protein